NPHTWAQRGCSRVGAEFKRNVPHPYFIAASSKGLRPSRLPFALEIRRAGKLRNARSMNTTVWLKSCPAKKFWEHNHASKKRKEFLLNQPVLRPLPDCSN